MSAEPRPRRLMNRAIALAVAFATLAVLATIALAEHDDDRSAHDSASQHAAMHGDGVPAPGGPNDLDFLTNAPTAAPFVDGAREYTLTAMDNEIEVAQGVKFAAWTFNGTAPGPTLRATEGDRVRIKLVNSGTHPHTIHTHGIHPANQDGVFETVDPGETFTYEFTATPGSLNVYHCHAVPLKKHIHRGLYGTFIIDPKKPLPKAKELVMQMTGFDTDADGENNFYTVNGKAFYYAKYPVKVRQGELVRIYLSNMTEFDLVNSFHLHGNYFRYYPTGTSKSYFYTDMVTQAQGERGVLEMRFPHPGKFMFHAHQSEFADLGWMGFFEVEPDPATPKGQPNAAAVAFNEQSQSAGAR